jgi:heat-inducible transcriptional repressor
MENLDSRKETLLKLTVRRFIKTAEPVGSAWLADESGLDVSSATIRNELAELEDLGYLLQPHTSAGRAPSEKGYRYYVGHFLEKKKPGGAATEALSDAVERVQEDAERLRRAAKALSELSHESVLVAFAPRDVYYTGLSNLFSKPEFRQLALVASMSRVLDHLDETMEKMFPEVTPQVRILIGSENPFGAECGLVIARAPFGGGDGVLGLLGPMRMDYDADAGLLESAVTVLKETA